MFPGIGESGEYRQVHWRDKSGPPLGFCMWCGGWRFLPGRNVVVNPRNGSRAIMERARSRVYSVIATASLPGSASIRRTEYGLVALIGPQQLLRCCWDRYVVAGGTKPTGAIALHGEPYCPLRQTAGSHDGCETDIMPVEDGLLPWRQLPSVPGDPCGICDWQNNS